MAKATSQFSTDKASLYLKKLCRHFAHKIEVSFDDQYGECQLPTGPATMQAFSDKLCFEVEVDHDRDLKRAKDIIESHLVRFAHKENLEKLDWEDEYDGSTPV